MTRRDFFKSIAALTATLVGSRLLPHEPIAALTTCNSTWQYYPTRWSDNPFTGSAFWDVCLTDAEIDLLKDGYHPSLVRPEHLVIYYPRVPTLKAKGGEG